MSSTPGFLALLEGLLGLFVLTPNGKENLPNVPF